MQSRCSRTRTVHLKCSQSLDGHNEHTSTTNQSGNKRTRSLEPTIRQRSSDIARKAGAGIIYVDSNEPENLSDEEETIRASEKRYKRRKRNGASVRRGNQKGGTGVLYYLRRTFLLNTLSERDSSGCRDDTDECDADGRSGNGSRARSNDSETAGSGVKYYLRRVSAKSVSFVPNILIANVEDNGKGGNDTGALGGNGNEDAVAMAMAAAVSAAAADTPRGSSKSRNDEEDVTLDHLEAGRPRRRRSSRGSDTGGIGGGESTIAGQMLSMKFLAGIQKRAKGLATQFTAKKVDSLRRSWNSAPHPFRVELFVSIFVSSVIFFKALISCSYL